LTGVTTADAGQYQCVAKIDDAFSFSEGEQELKVGPQGEPELNTPGPNPDPLGPNKTTDFNLILHPNPNNNTGNVEVTLPGGATLDPTKPLPLGCTPVAPIPAGTTVLDCPLSALQNSGGGKALPFRVKIGAGGATPPQLTVTLYGINGGNDTTYVVDPTVVMSSNGVAVPTLGEWALVMLALAVLGMAAVGDTRRA
jgi:hypothetical protein